MDSWREAAHLVEIVAGEPSEDEALTLLCEELLRLTGSSEAMVAALNTEIGVMEVLHGAGPGITRVFAAQSAPHVTADHSIVSSVAREGRTLVTGDVSKEASYHEIFPSTQSELAAPVSDRYGRLIAVVNLECDRKDAYTERHVQICEMASFLVGSVLRRKENRLRQEALSEVGVALATAIDEQELIDRVLQVVQSLLHTQECSLFLREESRGFVLRGSTSHLRRQVGHIEYQPDEGCTGWVCSRGQAVLLADPQADPRWRGKHLEVPANEIAGFLATPVYSRGQSIGAVRAIRRKSANPLIDTRFTEDDLHLIRTIADQFSAGLANIRNFSRLVQSERMSAWGELSAKSSHMIGNRVFALKGSVNELKHLLAEPELDRTALAEIHESLSLGVRRIEEILNEFRDFITATRVNRSAIELNPLVLAAVEETAPKEGPVVVRTVLAKKLPKVFADEAKLLRALCELIENAMQHMDSGTITVKTSLMANADARAKPWLRIEVHDSGPGLSAEAKEMAFHPFYTSRTKGMGLGLSIVKGVVDAHAGKVYEEGKSRRGATFVILLPALDRP